MVEDANAKIDYLINRISLLYHTLYVLSFDVANDPYAQRVFTKESVEEALKALKSASEIPNCIVAKTEEDLENYIKLKMKDYMNISRIHDGFISPNLKNGEEMIKIYDEIRDYKNFLINLYKIITGNDLRI